MIKDIPMFKILEIETSSYCPWRCKTCIRQSHPNRKKLEPYFRREYLPMPLIMKAILDSQSMGFRGHVCLGHHNEPMLDSRIVEIAKFAKQAYIGKVFCCTNGIALTPEVIKEVDGVFDTLHIAVYIKNDEKRLAREEELRQSFSKTSLTFVGNKHVTTHYSPNKDLYKLIKEKNEKPCTEVLHRMIINVEGNHLLCCDDVYGRWNLGNIRDNTVEELWYSKEHVRLVKMLLKPGGRKLDPYCKICPRY